MPTDQHRKGTGGAPVKSPLGACHGPVRQSNLRTRKDLL